MPRKGIKKRHKHKRAKVKDGVGFKSVIRAAIWCYSAALLISIAIILAN